MASSIASEANAQVGHFDDPRIGKLLLAKPVDSIKPLLRMLECRSHIPAGGLKDSLLHTESEWELLKAQVGERCTLATFLLDSAEPVEVRIVIVGSRIVSCNHIEKLKLTDESLEDLSFEVLKLLMRVTVDTTAAMAVRGDLPKSVAWLVAHRVMALMASSAKQDVSSNSMLLKKVQTEIASQVVGLRTTGDKLGWLLSSLVAYGPDLEDLDQLIVRDGANIKDTYPSFDSVPPLDPGPVVQPEARRKKQFWPSTKEIRLRRASSTPADPDGFDEDLDQEEFTWAGWVFRTMESFKEGVQDVRERFGMSVENLLTWVQTQFVGMLASTAVKKASAVFQEYVGVLAAIVRGIVLFFNGNDWKTISIAIGVDACWGAMWAPMAKLMRLATTFARRRFGGETMREKQAGDKKKGKTPNSPAPEPTDGWFVTLLAFISGSIATIVDGLSDGVGSFWDSLTRDFARVSRFTKTVGEMWAWFQGVIDYAMSFFLDEQQFFDRLAHKYPRTQECLALAATFNVAAALTPREIAQFYMCRVLARAEETRVPKMLLTAYRTWTSPLAALDAKAKIAGGTYQSDPVTFMIRGGPGIGKTTLVGSVTEMNREHMNEQLSTDYKPGEVLCTLEASDKYDSTYTGQPNLLIDDFCQKKPKTSEDFSARGFDLINVLGSRGLTVTARKAQAEEKGMRMCIHAAFWTTNLDFNELVRLMSKEFASVQSFFDRFTLLIDAFLKVEVQEFMEENRFTSPNAIVAEKFGGDLWALQIMHFVPDEKGGSIVPLLDDDGCPVVYSIHDLAALMRKQVEETAAIKRGAKLGPQAPKFIDPGRTLPVSNARTAPSMYKSGRATGPSSSRPEVKRDKQGKVSAVEARKKANAARRRREDQIFQWAKHELAYFPDATERFCGVCVDYPCQHDNVKRQKQAGPLLAVPGAVAQEVIAVPQQTWTQDSDVEIQLVSVGDAAGGAGSSSSDEGNGDEHSSSSDDDSEHTEGEEGEERGEDAEDESATRDSVPRRFADQDPEEGPYLYRPALDAGCHHDYNDIPHLVWEKAVIRKLTTMAEDHSGGSFIIEGEMGHSDEFTRGSYQALTPTLRSPLGTLGSRVDAAMSASWLPSATCYMALRNARAAAMQLEKDLADSDTMSRGVVLNSALCALGWQASYGDALFAMYLRGEILRRADYLLHAIAQHPNLRHKILTIAADNWFEQQVTTIIRTWTLQAAMGSSVRFAALSFWSSLAVGLISAISYGLYRAYRYFTETKRERQTVDDWEWSAPIKGSWADQMTPEEERKAMEAARESEERHNRWREKKMRKEEEKEYSQSSRLEASLRRRKGRMLGRSRNRRKQGETEEEDKLADPRESFDYHLLGNPLVAKYYEATYAISESAAEFEATARRSVCLVVAHGEEDGVKKKFTTSATMINAYQLLVPYHVFFDTTKQVSLHVKTLDVILQSGLQFSTKDFKVNQAHGDVCIISLMAGNPYLPCPSQVHRWGASGSTNSVLRSYRLDIPNLVAYPSQGVIMSKKAVVDGVYTITWSATGDKGMCGSPVFQLNEHGGRFVGIHNGVHTDGPHKGLSLVTIVDAEVIADLVAKAPKRALQVPQMSSIISDDTIVVGRLAGPPKRTKGETAFAEAPVPWPHTKELAKLQGSGESDPWRRALAKLKGKIDNDSVGQHDWVINPAKEHLKAVNVPTGLKVIPFERVNDTSLFPPIGSSKSAGYPYGTKGEFIVPGGLSERGLEILELARDVISEGQPWCFFATASLKDEKVSAEKAAAGDTRVFYVMDAVHFLLCRAYIGEWAEAYKASRTGSHCLGVTPGRYGEILAALGGYSDKREFAALDMKGCDVSTRAKIAHAFMWDFVRVYGNENPIFLTEYGLLNRDNFVRMALLEAMFTTVVVFPDGAREALGGGNVVLYNHVNKSGGFITTQINDTQADASCREVIAHSELTPQWVHYSDDTVVRVPLGQQAEWLSRAKAFSERTGVVYTGADKQGVKFGSVEEMDILSRRFMRIDGSWIGVLSPEVANNIMAFYRKKNFLENYPAQILSALVDLSPHEAEYMAFGERLYYAYGINAPERALALSWMKNWTGAVDMEDYESEPGQNMAAWRRILLERGHTNLG